MEIFANPCPWYVAGPLLGLLVAGLLWTINKPLGALGGYVDSVKWLVEREEPAPTWRVWFLAGIVSSGALSALAAGGWHPTLSYGAFISSFGATLGTGGAVLFAAGTLIGSGARRGGGCTSGHGMCGMAFGSPASIACTMTFMGTAIVVTPGPVAAQLGRGQFAALATLTGIFAGVALFGYLKRRREAAAAVQPERSTAAPGL